MLLPLVAPNPPRSAQIALKMFNAQFGYLKTPPSQRGRMDPSDEARPLGALHHPNRHEFCHESRHETHGIRSKGNPESAPIPLQNWPPSPMGLRLLAPSPPCCCCCCASGIAPSPPSRGPRNSASQFRLMGLHADMVPTRGLFIDGHWVEPAQGKRIPIINPTTEEPVGDIPAATSEDVDAAVKAAKEAFHRNKGKDWAKATGAHRATYLRKIAKRVAERKSELAKLESIDCGKPIDEAEWDMDDVSGCFEYYADLAEKLDERQYAPVELPMEQFKCNILREPMGVVGLITPWNYPLLMGTWKVAAALAAGCTAVLKPSEIASVTCLELASIAKEVGLPRGVLNVITGYGPEAGAPLASHPGVNKIAFTGSTNTGKSIMTAASQFIKPVTLELGGKSPIIVFEDADIEKAVEWAMFGAFWTNGQICSATSRLLLQESIADEFLKKLASWASSIKVSDPLEQGCRLGPLVNENQYKKVKEFVRVAQEEGATLVCGGKRPDHLTKGYFLEPTVLSNVKPHMQIWTDEVFGPVLAVATFKTEEEALTLANDTQYGLGGAVISKDDERCKRVAEALECGIVWINCSQPCFCQAPWGGNKRSGFGRELGEWGLENYLSVKQVTRYISNDDWGWYPKPSKL